MKKTGEEWHKLTDKQKEKYNKLAELDKVRYKKENDNLKMYGYFVNKDSIKSTNILPELKDFPKDTVLPQKPLSSYLCYISDP